MIWENIRDPQARTPLNATSADYPMPSNQIILTKLLKMNWR